MAAKAVPGGCGAAAQQLATMQELLEGALQEADGLRAQLQERVQVITSLSRPDWEGTLVSGT